MNNQDKNTYVKKQITSALLRLLHEKPLEKITVSELTDTACVGRVSFYRNFESTQDVLFQQDKRLLSEWTAKFESEPESDLKKMFGSLFQHYKDHADFYMLLYQNGLTETMLEAIKQRCGLTPDIPDNREAYGKAFIAYGIYGWLMEWMARGMVESADEINAMFQA